MRLTLFLIFFFLLSNLQAQNEKFERYSINPKLGTQYDIETGIGTTYGLAINIFSHKIVYSSSYFYTDETMLFGGSEPKETLNEINFMLGRYFGERYFRIEGQFGLGLLWGQNRGEQYYSPNSGYQYPMEKFTAVGLPLKIGLKYIPFTFMSIGIDLQANLNLEKSFFNTFISIEFGILRNEIK